jgi:hypothetical protein
MGYGDTSHKAKCCDVRTGCDGKLHGLSLNKREEYYRYEIECAVMQCGGP